MLYRILLVAGFILMLLGAVDPLEGCVLILAGAVLCAFTAFRRGSRHRRIVFLSTALVALGVAAMFILTAIGGVGGRSPHSVWWALTVLPYPVGWIIGLVAGVLRLRETFGRPTAVPVGG